MKYLKLIILLFSTVAFSQDYKALWSETVQDELNGKTESAYNKSQNIYALAKKENNEEQIIKCFFYVSKFRQTFDEKAQASIISSLREEIAVAKPTSKAILNYIYGEILSDFLNYHFYKIKSITTVQGSPSAEITTWSINDFINEITKSFNEAFVNSELLQQTSISSFKEILEIPVYVDGKNYSLHELLHNEISNRYIKFLSNYNFKNDLPFTNEQVEKLYTKTPEFIKVKDNSYSLLFQSYLKLWQEKEAYLQRTSPQELDNAKYKRLLSIDQLFNMPKNLNSALEDLEKNTTNKALFYELSLRKIKQSIQFSNKEEKPNDLKEAIKQLDEIIKLNPNEYTTTEAQLIKDNILNKFLHIKLNQVNYEGENTRAYVEFRNLDILKVSYYKISTKDYLSLNKYHQSKNDETLKFINSKKPFLESFKTLPNPKNHHQYSTEVLMDKLPLGYYLIVFEDADKDSNTQIEKNFCFYHITNISYLEDENKNSDLFYLTNRKTGKPLSNAYLCNKEKTINADTNGKISYPKQIKDKKNYLSNTYLIENKDTLAFNYIPSTKYDNDDDREFKAKAMIYLDRAIYRPGQKVYFKGILIQDKDNKKSVVPYVTTHITIEDASYETIKEFDLQTNEFGSFSGEFDIPKNCLTGNFSIEVDEPEEKIYSKDKKYYNKKEEEHSFWDIADFESNTFYFKVEEYKRPTFEITVDKIKETYSVGDNIILKGHAKTLAGSNLTNVAVRYSISRNYNTDNYKSSNDQNYIQKEITTDSEGIFTIPISFTVENLKDDSLKDISISINIDVIDTNGETRTLTHSIFAFKETLKIKANIASTLFEEKDNTINIDITNSDDSTIQYQGKIEIYKKEKSNYLKNRAFEHPELSTISEEDFKKFFPYEPYKDIKEDQLTLINTIPFDTHNGDEIALPKLLKNHYKTTTSIIDTKGNLIQQDKHFEVKSKENPSLEGKIFGFKRINREDENEIHFEFNTSIPELYITTIFYNGENSIEEKITKTIDGKGIVSFKKLKNPKYDYSFFFTTQWENMSFSQNVTLAKEDQSRKIDFEVVSFRNKIEPGSKENWSFKITDNKLETEVLASMYDSSLDVFKKENWRKPSFYNYAYPNYPDISNYNTNEVYFSTKTKKIYYQKVTFAPRFEWFGFNFISSKNNYVKKQYEQNVAQTQIIRLGTKTVTGTVSDSSGPLPGVNLVVKGTTIGVQTDFDGSYTIQTKEGEVLVYSFMGMNDVSKVVGSSNTINTKLQDDSKQLSEVVVTGLSIIKEEGTNNPNIIIVASNEEDLKYFKNFVNILSGKVSGLQITDSLENYQISSKRVILRGARSISSSNEALIIIDGSISNISSLQQISPELIDNLTILKGAEGSALYGSDGVNGVVIVTTKNTLKELSNVKTRTNFNETAFFYPHLTTDRKGKIAFNFTTPESLTRWKLRLLGHDKNADMGTFETEIISQKDLMVMPNTPRFLRETDTITLSAKVVNLTPEVKSGNAVLQLFDAVTGNAIDTNCLNTANIKTFNCKAKESVFIDWIITIPEGIKGIQYKVIAKSGNFSDGEENILPVLSNKILVTEALPIWIRENSKKEFVLENLKNTTSKTLKHQSFTFEYTSNPTWLAIQSLPYLMEFEHECAEQTFARFYANTIASKIIESQPKIVEVFEKWRKEPNKKSKIEMNEELKSIVLRETPWFFESDETENNRRLASLFELQKLKESNESALKKLEEKQRESGGFAWFDGGQENYYVTQHILSGIGHLNKIFSQNDLNSITDKAIPFVDSKFITNTQQQRKEKRRISDTELQYLYCRSFYNKTNPITNDTLKKAIQYQIQQSKSNWLQLGLGQKAMLALSAKRFGDSIYAKKIVTHLKETAIKNSEKGMYWLENVNGYYWFDSPIENQALLIETFAELENDPTIINDLKAWLIHQKQRENWGTTKATTEAVYALLSNETNLTETKIDNNYNIGNKQLLDQKIASAIAETASGYFKLQWKPEEVNKELATITIENKSSLPNYGGAYWQYFENLESIKTSNITSLNIKKEVYKKMKDEKGDKLIPLKESAINIGDKLTIRLVINANANLEFVHLKDLRASCLEPIDVISKYKESNDLWYYMSTKDTATHFFFDDIKQGTYVLEYDVRVNNSGFFNNGIATLQSMYAPEFTSHSTSQKINVIGK